MSTQAIIVNYRSALWTPGAVRSVLESTGSDSVRVTVVDNSCDPEEYRRLCRTLPTSVELLRPTTNLGFGRACNLAAARHASARVLLVNPDARLLPDCLERLQRTLDERPQAGAVAPQLFWDDNLAYHLPPPYPAALFLFDLWRLRGSLGRRLTPLCDRLWRRHSLTVWRGDQPIPVSNLSGAVVLIRRRHLPTAGEIFDPRFFLYFEDSDLFLRMRRRHHVLLLDPCARAVHYYDQCAQADWLEKRAQLMRGRDQFLARHYPLLARFGNRPGTSSAQGASAAQWLEGSLVHAAPFTLPVPAALHDGWLFEWSPHADFIPAVGRFGTGPCLRFGAEDWRRLAPGRYYGRLGRPERYGAWTGRFTWEVLP